MSKNIVNIQVLGKPMAGKSTVVEAIEAILRGYDIETTVLWGSDGPPSARAKGMLMDRIKAVAKKTKVILAEITASRQSDDELNEVRVLVEVDAGGNAIVRLRVAGEWLTKGFGSHGMAVERARALAARLGNICDANVEDKVPRAYEVRQRSDFNPTP